MENIRHVGLNAAGDKVRILDQSRLPGSQVFLELSELPELCEAITALRVRGAPAIGIFAGYALYVLARNIKETERGAFLRKLGAYGDELRRTRPTAVNLNWAINRMLNAAESCPPFPESNVLPRLRRECDAIWDEDARMCAAISEYGLTLIHDGDGILTHCNAGALAASVYGTALGPVLMGRERGMNFHVYADETRPLLQGARLTAWELCRAGVDVTLICDNMASAVMGKGLIKACLVGCDRIAANGDTANKIGTSGVAILARYYGIPFYVLGPTSTLDFDCPDGDHIEIEERDGDEIRSLWYSRPMAPSDVRCCNPAFDVTDHSLITAIVTENGICYPPFEKTLRR